jgi:hypothetical protein
MIQGLELSPAEPPFRGWGDCHQHAIAAEVEAEVDGDLENLLGCGAWIVMAASALGALAVGLEQFHVR